MNKIIINICLFFNLFAYSQKDTLDISNFNSYTTDNKALKEFSKKHENKQTFSVIKDTDGKIYKIGDSFKLGIPHKPVGALENSNFLGVYGCFDAIETNIPMTTFLTSMRLPGQGWSGSECKIEKIGIRKSFGYATPFVVLICNGKQINVSTISGCIANKELIDPNAPMTSDDAISKLKALKEKLDLELITKEEYDNQKKELSKFIK